MRSMIPRVDTYGLGFAAPLDDLVQAPDDAFNGQ
jgi:hypothetical protein